MKHSGQSLELIKPLLTILKNKLLVWSQHDGMGRAVIAVPDKHDLAYLHEPFPRDVVVERRELRASKVTVKGPRYYADRSNLSARWPDDGLQSKRHPIFFCVLGGKADFGIGNFMVRCREGHFIFLLPGTPFPDGSRPHLEGNNSNGYCDLLQLSSSGNDMLGCWVCHSKAQQHFELPFESCYIHDRQSVDIFNTLVEEFSAYDDSSRPICNLLLPALWLSIVRALEKGEFYQFPVQMEDRASDVLNEDPIVKAQHFIKGYLHRPITVGQVARHVYLSRTHFSNLFREKTGQTVIEYLTECRLNEAKALLLDTKWSIAFICKKVGVTPTHLRAIFQSHIGMSPREFRKQGIGKSEKEKVENRK
jgi:AraC-like DNA-binding protein